LWGILRGILNGAYEGVEDKVIVEKDRGWATNIDITEKVLGYAPKIISPVRPVPEIIASFILVAERAGKNSKIYDEVRSAKREMNSWSLSRVIWEKYVYPNWRAFGKGYTNRPDCFLLVEYEDLVTRPTETMEKVYDYVGVVPMEPVTDGLVNPNPENDAVYGLPGLHDIRKKLERVSPPAEEVLGKECYEFWRDRNLEFWRG
jgi:sulfotransferase